MVISNSNCGQQLHHLNPSIGRFDLILLALVLSSRFAWQKAQICHPPSGDAVVSRGAVSLEIRYILYIKATFSRDLLRLF